MAKKEKKYCEWCGGETNSPAILMSKIPLLEEIENKISSLGRGKILDDYYEGEIDAPPISRAEIYAYMDLLSEVEKRVICEPCLENDLLLNDKYYSGLVSEEQGLLDVLNYLANNSPESES